LSFKNRPNTYRVTCARTPNVATAVVVDNRRSRAAKTFMVNARRGKDQLGTKSQIPIDFARGAPRRREFGKKGGRFTPGVP
jgi:hypothetical protein